MRARLRLREILAGALLFASLSGCAYLGERQGELIFRPSRDVWWGYPASNLRFEERWVAVGANGDRLHAFWAAAEDPTAPALLYLHGARWNLTGSVNRIERWRRMGFSVLAIDYRGFGRSTDVSPTEVLSYEDAEAAWDYLAHVAPGRKRYIVGHSLGGAIAAELALRRPEASGVVLEATFTSIRDMVKRTAWGFLPVGLILHQEFDTLSKIARLRQPLLIAHGTQDRVVPFDMGEQLYQSATAPKRFIRVEGGSHHNLSGAASEAYRAALVELFGLPAVPGSGPAP